MTPGEFGDARLPVSTGSHDSYNMEEGGRTPLESLFAWAASRPDGMALAALHPVLFSVSAARPLRLTPLLADSSFRVLARATLALLSPTCHIPCTPPSGEIQGLGGVGVWL